MITMFGRGSSAAWMDRASNVRKAKINIFIGERRLSDPRKFVKRHLIWVDTPDGRRYIFRNNPEK